MGEKITYLFGAGASYNALPLVKDIYKGPTIIKDGLSRAMRNCGDLFKEQKVNFSSPTGDKIISFANDLHWLADASKDYFTVDTLAKYFYIEKHTKNYNRLKRTLSIFLDIEQIINKRFDNRYLNFLISLIDEEIPQHVNFLSWNYDSQLEYALKRFTNQRDKINSYPFDLKKSNLSILKNFPDRIPNFKICHLNGRAGLIDQDDEFIQLDHEDIFEYFKDLGTIESTTHKHNLFFAWENDISNPYLCDRIDHAHQLILGSTILVVIGYSFPFFNRHLDKKIFNSLKQDDKLKKIYFQDPNLDGSFLYNQFALDKSKTEIIHIKNTNQFYVPFEL